jgi:hypothetical protein
MNKSKMQCTMGGCMLILLAQCLLLRQQVKYCSFEIFAPISLIYTILGEIIACILNCPGSWHDSHIARSIYKKLCDKTPEGFYLVADTAFP